jgi:hypothetical protein
MEMTRRIPAPLLILLLALTSLAAVAASIAFGSSGIDAPWERLAAGDPLVHAIVF